jgi:putative transposase
VHDRFQQWQKEGIFREMWQAGVLEYDQAVGLEWQWQSMDGAMSKAPLGGEATGPNPTDRAKKGTKRSVLTEAEGIPLAVAVAGANRNDMKLVEATLSALVVERPEPTARAPQNMCMDKGYDYEEVEQLLQKHHYTPHIAKRAKKSQPSEPKSHTLGYRARRWVVERTHSWMNRFRRILIRWEKKLQNYEALVQFACAYIAFHAAWLFE